MSLAIANAQATSITRRNKILVVVFPVLVVVFPTLLLEAQVHAEGPTSAVGVSKGAVKAQPEITHFVIKIQVYHC